MLWLFSLACTSPDMGTSPFESGDTTEALPWMPHSGGVVELVASDGTVLVGDYYPASEEGRPSMLLYGDFYGSRVTVPHSFIESFTSKGWNVLVMDWRSFGDSGGDEYISDAAYLDMELAIGFLDYETHGPAPAIFGGICFWALMHAYKAETLDDRTQIAGFGMMPFTDNGACNILNPDQMPNVPTLFVVNSLDDAEDPYVAAGRANWVFLTEFGALDGWARLDDPSHEDSDALREAIFDFFVRVLDGELG
jgi:hypothetical protein